MVRFHPVLPPLQKGLFGGMKSGLTHLAGMSVTAAAEISTTSPGIVSFGIAQGASVPEPQARIHRMRRRFARAGDDRGLEFSILWGIKRDRNGEAGG